MYYLIIILQFGAAVVAECAAGLSGGTAVAAEGAALGGGAAVGTYRGSYGTVDRL